MIDTGMVETSIATSTAGNWEGRDGTRGVNSHVHTVPKDDRCRCLGPTHHMSEPYLGLDNDYVIDHVTL